MDKLGKVALGGAFNEPCGGAVILFNADACSTEEIRDFALGDPCTVPLSPAALHLPSTC